MKTKIGVKGAEFFAYHGFYDEEQKTGHTFIVDLEVFFDYKSEEKDQLEHTVNYELLYDICKVEMNDISRLIETVAYRIIKKVQIDFPYLLGGKVIIQKKGPQLGGKVDRTVIEMEF